MHVTYFGRRDARLARQRSSGWCRVSSSSSCIFKGGITVRSISLLKSHSLVRRFAEYGTIILESHRTYSPPPRYLCSRQQVSLALFSSLVLSGCQCGFMTTFYRRYFNSVRLLDGHCIQTRRTWLLLILSRRYVKFLFIRIYFYIVS